MLNCLVVLAALSAETLAVDCRGFGHVEAVRGADADGVVVTEFKLADVRTAERLASKRQADLLGYGNLCLRSEKQSVLELDGVGAWCVGTRGERAYEVYSPDAGRAVAAVRRLGLRPPKDGDYPRYLDCFDNCAVAVWIGSGGRRHEIPFDFEYLKELGLSFCAANPGVNRLVGPGVIDYSPFDWQRAMAERHGIPYRQLLFGAGSHRSWLFNEVPLPYAVPADGYYDAPYHFRVNQVGAGFVEPVGQAAREWAFRRELARRYGGEDSLLLGWHGCGEIPTASILDLSSLARTPYVVSLWQKTHKGPVPVAEDFLGGGPKLDLRGVWSVRIGDEGEWIDASAHDMSIMLHRGNRVGDAVSRKVWMRRTFRVPDERRDDFRYLHCAVAQIHNAKSFPPEVKVNGVPCPRVSPRVAWSYCYDLGAALRAGENEILLQTNGQNLPGYFFANATPLRGYFDMSEEENRRWFEAIEFSAKLRVRLIEGNVRAIRSVDAERPIKIMASHSFYDHSLALCRRFGAYQHDTGGTAAFWAPMQGEGYSRSHRLPFSAEQGGPPKDEAELRTTISRYLNYGNAAADLVFAVGHYARNPGVDAWLRENIGLVSSIGKMRSPEPKIAVLRSTRMLRLGFSDVWDWDIGRGIVQSTGRTLSYVETCDLTDRDVLNRFDVIVDDATFLLTDEECRGLRSWVERGGTFVAQHHTGRHSVARRDAWPLLAAMGMKPSARDVEERLLGRGRFIRLGTERHARDAKWFASLFDRLRVPKDCLHADKNFWGEKFEAKNGVYDLYLSTFMNSVHGQDGAKEVRRCAPAFSCAVRPDKVWDFGAKGRPEVRAGWSDGVLTLPEHDYLGFEAQLFATPHADPGGAALRWLRAFAETWHPVEKVRWPFPPKASGRDYLPLDDGWDCQGVRFRLGTYAAMGLKEREDRTFVRKVRLPPDWRGREISLVYDAQPWCGGLSPEAELLVNGRPAPMSQPICGRKTSSFRFDMTEAAAKGEVELKLTIFGSRLLRPDGVTESPTGSLGLFYLYREPLVRERRALEGPWYACVDYGARVAVKPGEGRSHTYYETDFNLPPRRAGERLMLSYPGGLNGVNLNGRLLEVDNNWREKLDVTGLVIWNGRNNLKVYRRSSRVRQDMVSSPDDAPLARAELLFLQEPEPSVRPPRSRGRTALGIDGCDFLINGKPSYDEVTNSKAKGLLFNARFIQGVFDDRIDRTRFDRFGRTFDPDRNTDGLVRALPEWRAAGLRAITVGLQGGGPCYTVANGEIDANPFTADGRGVDEATWARLRRVVEAADALGMVVIVSVFYPGQIGRLANEDAVVEALKLVATRLSDAGNVIIEPCNEHDLCREFPLVQSDEGMAWLLEVTRSHGGRPVGCSCAGGHFGPLCAEASDVVILHGNGQTRNKLRQLICEARRHCPGKPILVNEDSPDVTHLGVCLAEHASWGYYNNLTKQEPPCDWTITPGEDEFFARRLSEAVGLRPESPGNEYRLLGLGRDEHCRLEPYGAMQELLRRYRRPPLELGDDMRFIRLAALYPERIDRVEFFRNGELLDCVYCPPFSVGMMSNWSQEPTVNLSEGERVCAVVHGCDGSEVRVLPGGCVMTN